MLQRRDETMSNSQVKNARLRDWELSSSFMLHALLNIIISKVVPEKFIDV